MSSFIVGTDDSGKDIIVTVPVPPGWTAVHDQAERSITVYLQGTNKKAVFVYDLFHSINGGVFLKNNMMVTGPRYGRRTNASTALELLAVLSSPFNK